MIVVFRESDLNDTIESAKWRVEVQGAFCIHDIFEMSGEPSIIEATLNARSRIKEKEEQNMAVLYFYLEETCQKLKPNGWWASPDPAPLEVEEITYVFNRVISQPWYENQMLATHTSDGIQVFVHNGQVKVGRHAD